MLSPSELSRLGSLELIARAVVEGAIAGGHRSPFHGYSAEFSQYRDYRQGDDPKYVDWRLFARTDRVYTKQFRETTNATVVLAIDTSASMRFGDGVTKGRYAQMLASALALVVSRQGDAVGLLSCGEQPRLVVPPAAGVLQRTRVFAAIEQLAFGGTADVGAAVRLANDVLRSRGLLVVLSDLYDVANGDPAQRELRRAVRAGHDVSVFHVISPDERTPALDAGVEFEDLETGEARPVSPAMAGDYRLRFEQFLDSSRERLVRQGIDYMFASTDAAVSAVLRRYLIRRAA